MVLPTREVLGGKTVTVQAAFRHYDSAADYFKGRFEFLKKNPRYKRLFAADDCIAEAHLFQACGYATDPNYGATLVNVIRKYGLVKYNA